MIFKIIIVAATVGATFWAAWIKFDLPLRLFGIKRKKRKQ